MHDRRTFGNEGEDAVCQYLLNKGFSILQKNYATKCGEIDIIAQNDSLICFVEVKTRRQHYAGTGEIITYSKQQKIIKTALHFLQVKSIPQPYIARFDVAFVIGSPTIDAAITYLSNAFTVE